MKRLLVNLLAAVSLVLFILTAVFWVRGYSTYDWFGLTAHMDGRRFAHYYRLGSGDGAFEVLYAYEFVANGRDEYGFTWNSEPSWGFSLFVPKTKTFWFRHNFAWHAYFVPNGHRRQLMRMLVPAWVLLFLFAMPIAIRFRQWLRPKKQSGMTLCASCGYDLRATPNRCPECGMVPIVD